MNGNLGNPAARVIFRRFSRPFRAVSRRFRTMPIGSIFFTVAPVGALLILAFATRSLHAAGTKTYWIAPCTNPATRCLAGDADLERWALEAWERASGGRLHFAPAERSAALFRLVWALPARGVYGETVPIDVDGERGAQLNLRVEDGFTKDKLLRDTIVYLTCVHEAGHALGLGHTSNFDDIMYSFQFGGDIDEYFGRYRRKLTNRDDIRKYSGISPADRSRLLERLSSTAF